MPSQRSWWERAMLSATSSSSESAVGEHARARLGVGLDDLELRGGEPPGLEQDRVRDGDLADVVQRRGVADVGDARARRARAAGPSRAASAATRSVCSRVLSSRYSAASASRRSISTRSELEVAPAPDRQRGERGLEVARPALERGAVEQRAQAPHGAEVVVLVGGTSRSAAATSGGPLRRSSGSSRSRSSASAGAEGDDHVGRAGQRGLGGGLGVRRERDLARRPTRGEPRARARHLRPRRR